MTAEDLSVSAAFEALEMAAGSHDAGDASRVVEAIVAADQLGARNPEGATPLVVAADYGRADICELLLQAGADPAARDQYGRTPSAAFGILAEELSEEDAPGEAECRRADMLFAAYGAPERPAIYVVAYRDGAPIRGVEAHDRYWRFTRALKEANGSAGLPRHRADRSNEDRLFVWLFPAEVEQAREVVRRQAAASGYGETVTFKSLAEAALAAGC